MGLLERVSTLIRANLNDMIDRAEDPEKMIKQVILDMENQYLQVKTQVAVSIADQHMLEKKQREQEDTGKDWMRKAEVAVEKTAGRSRPRRARPLPDRPAPDAKLSGTGERPESPGGHLEKRARETRTETRRSQVQARSAAGPPSPQRRARQSRQGAGRTRRRLQKRHVRSPEGTRPPHRSHRHRRGRPPQRRRRRASSTASTATPKSSASSTT